MNVKEKGKQGEEVPICAAKSMRFTFDRGPFLAGETVNVCVGTEIVIFSEMMASSPS